MREIEIRVMKNPALRLLWQKKWVYAKLPFSSDVNSDNIIAETLGQYTGKKDKNDTEIYEGDYVLDKNEIYRIVWCDIHGRFFLDFTSPDLFLSHYMPLSGMNAGCIEVVGNIHEHTLKELKEKHFPKPKEQEIELKVGQKFKLELDFEIVDISNRGNVCVVMAKNFSSDVRVIASNFLFFDDVPIRASIAALKLKKTE